MGRFLLKAFALVLVILALCAGSDWVVANCDVQKGFDNFGYAANCIIPVGCLGIAYNLLSSRRSAQKQANKE